MKRCNNQKTIVFLFIIIIVLAIGFFFSYYVSNKGGLEGLVVCDARKAKLHMKDQESCEGVGCQYCASGLCQVPGKTCGSVPSGFDNNVTKPTKKTNNISNELKSLFTKNWNDKTGYSTDIGVPVRQTVHKPTTEFDTFSAQYDALQDKYVLASVKEASQNNPQWQRTDLYDVDTQLSPFNMDIIYNTQDVTQKYSFLNSSFLYRPVSTNDNEYLSELYFDNNPLELERMCKGLDANSCSLVSSCIYAGNNKCLPGNKRGPFNSYNDINIDYYYYKGKCYGNCGNQTEFSQQSGSTPGSTTPGSTTPGSTTPGSTTPGSTTPGPTTPGSTTPGPTTPGSTTPGPTTPGPTTPGTTTKRQ